jgi:hypothetical protein
MHETRRSALSPSRTLYGGWDGHTESSAVASVAHEYGAAVVARGTVGTRHWARDQLIRQLPSKRTPRGFVSDAGPGGDWLSR